MECSHQQSDSAVAIWTSDFEHWCRWAALCMGSLWSCIGWHCEACRGMEISGIFHTNLYYAPWHLSEQSERSVLDVKTGQCIFTWYIHVCCLVNFLVLWYFGLMFWLIISGFLQILVGSEEGSLQLWNTKTCSLIHEFKGWNSPVRCCTSSPALDIVAVGCANGKVYVHNLRYDETVVTFLHTGRGPVTALSFRTGKHDMAT